MQKSKKEPALRYRLRGFLDLISSPLYQIQIGNGMPMTMARPANRVFPPPIPRASYICDPNNGKANPKRLRRKPINNRKEVAAKLRRTHFRNTFVADVMLAAYVKESTRYRVMGRLGTGSAVGTSIDNSSSSLQAGHQAKAKNSGTNYGHDPMDLSMSRPPIPTAESMSNCQPLGKGWRTYRRPTGMNKDPMIKAGIRISGFPTPLFFAR
jgi:hypothetical protein